MVWVKICGLTNIEDAQAAVEYGADALGFIFAPSKRKVEPESVREIIRTISSKEDKKIEKIGVFSGEPVERVREIAEYCGLTGVQLHGEESIEYCSQLAGYDVIKVFRVKDKIDNNIIEAYTSHNCIDRILMDTYVPEQMGGTGKTFSWEILANKEWQVPIIMAGGLTPNNVGEAIRIGCPFGVDVSSGVEKEPGKKDLQKLKEFIEKAKEA